MTTYRFTLILEGLTVEDLTAEKIDALHESGCDDALICWQHRRFEMEFDREAPTRDAAIVGAIADVERANTGATDIVLAVDRD